MTHPPHRTLHRRILSLWLPRLATDRLQRQDHWLRQPDHAAPLVLVAKERGADRVVSLDARAGEAGLQAGQTLAEARAIVPDVAVLPAATGADRAMLERIADWADRYTPMVGRDPPDGLFLDITGASHLVGGESALVADLLGRLGRQGFDAYAAIAPTAGAAAALVRTRGRGLVPEGASGEVLDSMLASLPVRALRLDEAITAGLERAGLRRIGDLIHRPRAAIGARFGADVLRRLDMARGFLDTPITPRQPVPPACVETGFGDPILTTDAVEAAADHLSGLLAVLLADRGQGAGAIQLSVFRVDGAIRRIDVALAAPSRDPAVFVSLLKLRLSALDDPLDPGFGYDLVRLAATRVVRLDAAARVLASLDAAADPAQSKELHHTLADRLAARFGPERVLAIAAADSHLPERADFLAPPGSGSASSKAAQSPPPGAPRPLRLFDPPEPAEVVASVPDGPPMLMRWRRRRLRIAAADGPERIAPEWWRTPLSAIPAPDRDYWRIEDTLGTRLWVFRAGPHDGTAPSRWFVHGVFA